MGEVFAGRYELLDPVATGGMGSIWRVLDRADGQVRAAKILRQSDAASLLRFVREQSMRVDHAHVVTPVSWAGVDDRVLFTMPLVRGGSVADLLRERGSLPVRWVAGLTDQLLQALAAVHAAGVVHRDVKPGNLLLDPTDGSATPSTGTGLPHLRLTDFGIAAPLDAPRMTHGSTAIGTPGYMAPEQWWGADPDPRSDLYAAAQVALEMLTGTRPSASRPGRGDPTATLRGGDALRDQLLDVLAGALSWDVDARPDSSEAMRRRLDDAGLLRLPQQPETEPIVPDRFDGGPSGPRPAGPPPATRPLPPRATAILGAPPTLPPTPAPALEPAPAPAPAPVARPRRGSALPGALLVTVGLVLLGVAAVLLLG